VHGVLNVLVRLRGPRIGLRLRAAGLVSGAVAVGPR
jgi:hypothetical protein